jgi:hypothetical protein
MPLNFTTYNISSPTPTVEVYSELQAVLLTGIFFMQFLQVVITLYYFNKIKRSD